VYIYLYISSTAIDVADICRTLQRCSVLRGISKREGEGEGEGEPEPERHHRDRAKKRKNRENKPET
jgi:hypothetical protein